MKPTRLITKKHTQTYTPIMTLPYPTLIHTHMEVTTIYPLILVWPHYRLNIPVDPSVLCVGISARIPVPDVDVSFAVLNALLAIKKQDVSNSIINH